MKIREICQSGLNISIFFAAAFLFCFGLWLASHSENLLGILIGILLVAHFGNTLFSLLHESVHRIFSSNRKINEAFGILAAAFFPTGLTFQRICHLGHHLRNRTDHEMFDLYYPGDSKFLKFAQWYAILTGVYWLSIPTGWLFYLFVPWSFRFFKSSSEDIRNTGAIMMHPFLNHPKKIRIRVELIFTILFQIFLFKVLDLKFLPTLAAYWAFGLLWGSLQYADHAWSPRDVQFGAWNLKVNGLTRLIFLNYHLHQVHHANPKMPWHLLPKSVDPQLPRPTFLRIYLEMWKGPRRVERDQTLTIPRQLELELQDEDMNAAT